MKPPAPVTSTRVASPTSVPPFEPNYRRNRQQQDLQVGTKTDGAHICDVKIRPLMHDTIATRIDLPEAGQPRLRDMTLVLPWGVAVDNARKFRSGSRPYFVVLKIALCVLLLPPSSLIYQVADQTAIACGIVSCWCVARRSIAAAADPRSRTAGHGRSCASRAGRHRSGGSEPHAGRRSWCGTCKR